jgi:hypothetical protein
MKTLLVHVKWDTDGMPVEECGFTESVVVLDAPDNYEEIDHNEETLSRALSDNFGFCHDGYDSEELPNKEGFIGNVSVMFWPKD